MALTCSLLLTILTHFGLLMNDELKSFVDFLKAKKRLMLIIFYQQRK